MSNKDPDWYTQTRIHNSMTQLTMALWNSPLIVFGLVYYGLKFFQFPYPAFIFPIAIGCAVTIWYLFFILIRYLKRMDVEKIDEDTQ